MAIPQETLDWLKEQMAFDIRGFIFYIPSKNMYFSEKYLENTPLDKIKEGYRKCCEYQE